jgi:hypothetical protein
VFYISDTAWFCVHRKTQDVLPGGGAEGQDDIIAVFRSKADAEMFAMEKREDLKTGAVEEGRHEKGDGKRGY